MKTDVYSRMFARLDDLVPGLSSISDDLTYFAAPRSPGETALFCSVSLCQADILELELAHDEVVGGIEHPSPWMKFRVNRARRTASLVAYQAGSHYEIVGDETIYPTCRHLPLNLFAVNWLGILVNLQFAFRAIAPNPCSTEESIV
jgi:hypothetical protein